MEMIICFAAIILIVGILIHYIVDICKSDDDIYILPTYEELLNCDEWKAKREEILERDEYECQYCHNRNRTLQVHHKYYLKYPNGIKVYPWEYPNEALITLCDRCHKWEHSKRTPKTYYTKYK